MSSRRMSSSHARRALGAVVMCATLTACVIQPASAQVERERSWTKERKVYEKIFQMPEYGGGGGRSSSGTSTTTETNRDMPTQKTIGPLCDCNDVNCRKYEQHCEGVR